MSKKLKQLTPVLLVFAGIVLLRLILFRLLDVCLTTDSYEYIAANGFSWLAGAPHRYRLPLYPLLIDVARAIFGTHGLSVICVGQLLVSLCSAVAFFAAMERISSRRWLNLVLTALYSLAPAVMGWDKTLLTESLSLSLTVFLFWAVICYLDNSKARYLLLAAAVLVLGCLLRAVFALYAALVFGFMLLRLFFPGEGEKSERRTRRIHDAKLLPIAAIPIVLLLVYGSLFYVRYGGFTLSDSGLGQQLSVVLQGNYYDRAKDAELRSVADELMTRETETEVRRNISTALTDILNGGDITQEEFESLESQLLEQYGSDRFLNTAFEEHLTAYYQTLYDKNCSASTYPQLYRARCYIMNNYDRDRIESFISQSIHAHRWEYLRFLLAANSGRYTAYKDQDNTRMRETAGKVFYESVLPAQSLSVAQGILLGIAELAAFLYLLLRKKRLSWLHLGLAGFLLSTGLLAVFGTNADFARTAQTILPFMYASAGVWLHAGADRLARQQALCLSSL